MGKKAVVFAGGGARGSYQVGVWRALDETGFAPDIITGTSVGSLNAAMMVQGDLALCEDLWMNIDTSNVLDWGDNTPGDRLALASAFAREIALHGGFGYSPLKAMLLKYIDEDRIRRSPVELGIVSVKYPSMQPVILYTSDIPPHMLVDHLLASAACFPMMKAYEIDGQRYVDGGYYENLPIKLALDRGADDIVAVDLQAVGRVRRLPKNALESVTLRTVKSDFDLGAMLVFSAETARFNMRLGYLDGMRMLSRLEGAHFAFSAGASAQLSERYMRILQHKLCSLGIDAEQPPKSMSEKMARISIARYIRKHWGRDLEQPQIMLALAEAAGVVLDVDPLQVYTPDTFAEALKARRLHPSRESLRKVEKWLQKPQFSRERLSELAEAASHLKPQQITEYALDFLHQSISDGQKQTQQLLLCTLLPREFAAALFLYLLA